MDIYDKLIDEVLLSLPEKRIFGYEPSEVCGRTDSSTLILTKESAFEFGGNALPALNAAMFTTNGDITDSVIIRGKDISEVSADTPYARIALIKLKNEQLPDEDEIYKGLKEIELSKYHVYPEGCLIRLSPETGREQLRVSKKAVKNGLSLKNIGFLFIEEYKNSPLVEAVCVIFITDNSYDYKTLRNISSKASEVTESLNKILQGLEISCDTCELRTICDEVEGLRKLHFGKEK